MILLMTLFINPSASHALAKAAMHHDIDPKIDKRDANKSGDDLSNP